MTADYFSKEAYEARCIKRQKLYLFVIICMALTVILLSFSVIMMVSAP